MSPVRAPAKCASLDVQAVPALPQISACSDSTTGSATGSATPSELDVHRDSSDADHDIEAQDRLEKAASIYTGRPPRASRFSLRLSAAWWRALQWIGMTVHFLAWPRPPKPDFVITIPSTLSTRKGQFKLHFYVPDQYNIGGGKPPSSERPMPYTASSAPHLAGHALANGNRPADTRSRTNHVANRPGGPQARSHSEYTRGAITHQSLPQQPSNRRWPVVVNFHGGGFTLGQGTDDARFARVVLAECDAIFVSVDYRLAPENPFPTAVEDGADALMYLIRHADALRIDPMRMATSGFSAGGNLALTAPLMMAELLHLHHSLPPVPPHPLLAPPFAPSFASPISLEDLVQSGSGSAFDPRFLSPLPHIPAHTQSAPRPGPLHRTSTNMTMASTRSTPIPISLPSVPPHRIVATATWYPITDYTISRADRRAASIRPKATLSPSLCNLFDSSYLYPATIDLAAACLSPLQATDEQLRRGIPPTVLFYTCEWDMLLREGEALARRLAEPGIDKRVVYRMIQGVKHGWDKMPTLLRPPAQTEVLYRECCATLGRLFDEVGAREV